MQVLLIPTNQYKILIVFPLLKIHKELLYLINDVFEGSSTFYSLTKFKVVFEIQGVKASQLYRFIIEGTN